MKRAIESKHLIKVLRYLQLLSRLKELGTSVQTLKNQTCAYKALADETRCSLPIVEELKRSVREAEERRLLHVSSHSML